MKHLIGSIIALVIIGLSLSLAVVSEKKGYEKGFEDGVTTALDSVNAIATQQLNNKTISSKFFIQSTDTLKFILSPKTIKMK